MVGSALAGLSHNVPFLIGARVLQGLAMGGLMALAQAIIGAAIPPATAAGTPATWAP